MEIRLSAEPRYDTASTDSVIGAVISPTRSPASPGPAMPATAMLAWILLLASERCRGSTRKGM